MINENQRFEVFYIRIVDTKDGIDPLGPFWHGPAKSVEHGREIVKQLEKEKSGIIISEISEYNILETNFDRIKMAAFRKLTDYGMNILDAEEIINRNKMRNRKDGGTEKYACESCGREFDKKFALTNHQKYCNQEITEEHKCKCGRIFGKKYALTNHLKHCKGKPTKKQTVKSKPKKEQPTPEEPVVFKCKCGRTFTKKFGLSNHQRKCQS